MVMGWLDLIRPSRLIGPFPVPRLKNCCVKVEKGGRFGLGVSHQACVPENPVLGIAKSSARCLSIHLAMILMSIDFSSDDGYKSSTESH